MEENKMNGNKMSAIATRRKHLYCLLRRTSLFLRERNCQGSVIPNAAAFCHCFSSPLLSGEGTDKTGNKLVISSHASTKPYLLNQLHVTQPAMGEHISDDGALPAQIDRCICQELGDYITPSTQEQTPALPNLFMEVKGSDGRGQLLNDKLVTMTH